MVENAHRNLTSNKKKSRFMQRLGQTDKLTNYKPATDYKVLITH